jgi:dihydroorotate dehydrogenase (fumarate)
MADLSTTYLGLALHNPIVASSSPLCEDIDKIKEMEDAGIAAVVLHSLFEEQVTLEQQALNENLIRGTESFAEAISYFPAYDSFSFAPDEYVEHIGKVKKSISIPVIGSLNGTSTGGWIEYAAKMEQAGADALELNIYYLPTNPTMTSPAVEDVYTDIVRAVVDKISIPVAVKLNPFISAIPNLASRLGAAGARGLVLFNRFYQPDIDPENLRVTSRLRLSTSDELVLRLRWIAILHGRIGCDLAITGGVHTAEDVVKGLLSGAAVTMTTSALLRNGIGHAATLRDGLDEWLDGHGHESVEAIRGLVSHERVAEPAAFERANYMKIIGTNK